MIIDSHCHLNMQHFKDDLDLVIRNAHKAGVNGMLTISTSMAETKDVINIAEKNKNIWCTVGVHPNNAGLEKNINAEDLERLSNNTNVVGIGETGLDYFRDNNDIANQKKLFIEHIAAARSTKLPVVIHTRNADSDTIQILKEQYKKGHFKAVIHCFTASEELAIEVLKMGMYISISGIITFSNAQKIRDTIKKVPLDRILIETDAPYLAPVPNRGKRNEPAFVSNTALYLSNLYNVSYKEFTNITTKNFFDLFSKAKIEIS